MASDKAYPASDFDHGSEAFMRDPYPAYEVYRERCPVARSDRYDGFHFVTRYADVKQVFQDFPRFSSAEGGSLPSQPIIMYPIDLDPPQHTAYRMILNPMFTIEAIHAHTDMIQRVVDDLIDHFAADGTADLAASLARPLLPAVILPLIGVPAEDASHVAAQVDVLVRRHRYDEAAIGAAFANIRDYLIGLAARRRLAPSQDDIVGLLLTSKIDGAPLSDDQIFRTLSIILAGGLDTTTSALLEAFLFLGRNPGAKATLLATDDWSGAIEEFVRFSSPVQGIKRVVAQDLTLHGVDMKAGDRIFAVLGSANRDPAIFDRPAECDLARHPNRHLGFGTGAHTCLGRHLARLEIRIAIKSVLDRIPDFSVDEAFVPEYVTGETRGMKTLPVRFAPSNGSSRQDAHPAQT